MLNDNLSNIVSSQCDVCTHRSRKPHIHKSQHQQHTTNVHHFSARLNFTNLNMCTIYLFLYPRVEASLYAYIVNVLIDRQQQQYVTRDANFSTC